jgi:hypothetical protein
MKSMWARFTHWTSNHPKITIGLAVGSFAIGVGLVLGAIFYPSPQAIVNVISGQLAPKNETTTTYYSPLTGVQVADEAATKQQVRAIMIENSPSARPQSSLKEAGVVFEAIAEGGITRLLTLHQEDRPDLIGPVRSLRPYYIDWLAPFDATVSHVGGSANALAEIRNGQYKDVDQFFNGKYYYRATDRAAPHNVYTTSKLLDDMNSSKGYTSSKFTGWPRKQDSPSQTPDAKSISIAVSGGAYDVHYDYDAANNNYVRSVGGSKHLDREKGQITPKVVIAIKVPSHYAFEDGNRLQMDTIGQGDAFIFQDGTITEAKWHKSSKKDQLTFYDKLGKEVPFNAGQTWITVTTPEKSVTWQ